jgi:hypothetical protein
VWWGGYGGQFLRWLDSIVANEKTSKKVLIDEFLAKTTVQVRIIVIVVIIITIFIIIIHQHHHPCQGVRVRIIVMVVIIIIAAGISVTILLPNLPPRPGLGGGRTGQVGSGATHLLLFAFRCACVWPRPHSGEVSSGATHLLLLAFWCATQVVKNFGSDPKLKKAAIDQVRYHRTTPPHASHYYRGPRPR